MAMELSRTEYPGLLSLLQPSPAVTLFRDRLRKAQALNTEIADWLQERRKIEETYAQGLLKLSKRPPIDSVELGTFQAPWSRIVNATAALANSHQQLGYRIESEVERPLRDFNASNKEWASVKAFESNLVGIAKQVDSAEEKAEKLRKKGSRAAAARVAEAAAAVEKALGDWDSQAPFIFEKLQRVDELRCNNLRGSLTRYHTLEADHGQRIQKLAEQCLQVLLDMDTNDEIKAFAAGATNGRSKNERQGSRAPTTAAAGMPSSTPSIVTDDSVSVQSAGSGGAVSGGGSIGGHTGALKRLGTVLRSRNRNSSMPYLSSGSPEKARSSDGLSARRDQPPITPASPRMSEFSSRTGSNRNLAIPSSPDVAGRPPTPKANSDSNPPTRNGTSPPSTGPDPLTSPAAPPTIALIGGEQPQIDAEGYTIAPPVTDIGGIPLEDHEEQSAPQFKVEIRNDVIPEEEEEADAALKTVANHLRAQNTATRKNRGRRDGRDVRNTVLFPSTPGPGDQLEHLNSSSPPLTPIRIPRPPAIPPSDGSDTQSIKSSRSASSLTGGIIKHPELTEPGLSSSLVEAVSMTFEAGIPTKSLVIGEVALAYNQPEALSEHLNDHTTELVRMDNISVLEKVAPNPAFINPIPEKTGEYSVKLDNIHKTSVAFKYQVRLDDPTLAVFAPVIVQPAWRIEPHQTSLILNYKPNPNYKRLNGVAEQITLRNVVFITGIEGATASSCQSKPVGAFSREKARLAWKLGDVVVGEEGSGTGKLLARFTTDGPARSTPVEMRWEIMGADAATAGSGLTLSTFVPAPATATAPEEEKEVDPFADDEPTSLATAAAESLESPASPWKPLHTIRRITSGKYVAM